jgi:LPXTG-site transpeptidase (sortase) family protein
MHNMTQFEKVWQVIYESRWQFLVVFFGIYTITYAILFAIDFVPEPIESGTESSLFLTERVSANVESEYESIITFDPYTAIQASYNNQKNEIVREEPLSITIPALNRTVRAVTPVSSAVGDLDNALLSGVVRHPDSVLLGEEGNVVILGHSSYLPHVLNRNFQALNGTQNLAWGDVIVVETEHSRYTYMVTHVFKAKASDASIPIFGVGKRLTLITCDSFATTDDRFIIEANLLKTEAR